jgi:hypothetical protein
MSQNGRDIAGQMFWPGDAGLGKQASPVKIPGDLNQRLRWHAPHARAGGPQGALINQYVIPGRFLDLPQRGKSGAPGTDDGYFYVSFHTDFDGLMDVHARVHNITGRMEYGNVGMMD